MNDTTKSGAGNDLLAQAMRKVFSETVQETVESSAVCPDDDVRKTLEGERP